MKPEVHESVIRVPQKTEESRILGRICIEKETDMIIVFKGRCLL